MTSSLPSRLPALAGGLLLLAGAGDAAAQSGRCLVDDPTGTPLNVRTAPNGAIAGTLPNGARVDPLDETTVGTKRWLFVSRDGERLGWVFAAYVVCDAGEGRARPRPSRRRGSDRLFPFAADWFIGTASNAGICRLPSRPSLDDIPAFGDPFSIHERTYDVDHC